MTTRSLIGAIAGTSLMLGLTACGSSKAPGVTPIPSAGLTAQVTTTPTPSSTTPTPTTPSTPLPAALSKKPKVVVPKGPSPKHLVIKDIVKGTGAAAVASSTVTVQYVGVLYSNGKQFDASWDNGGGQPTTLPLSNVIAGWTQGIPGMRVGGRRELIIPSSLAYKQRGRPPTIGPNAALVFVIDLHAVS